VSIVTRTGWQLGANIYPDGSVIGPAPGAIHYQGHSEATRSAFGQAGTLAQWQEFVAAPCAGNSRLVLALCAALSGPLLRPMHKESVGFHLVGPSSIGKSTALRVASSTWGMPDGLMMPWDSTRNGIGAVVKQRSDTLVLAEEIGQGDARQLGSIIYSMGNGLGKVRSTSTGEARTAVVHKVLMLSSGEVSVGEHMASVGQAIKAGHEARLIDVQARASQDLGILQTLHGFESCRAFIESLDQSCAQYHGTAARAWLAMLTDLQLEATLIAAIQAKIEVFLEDHCPPRPTGFVQRVCKRFAFVAAVGEVCAEQGLLPWQEDVAMNGVAECFASWLQGRGMPQVAPAADQAIEQIRTYLAQYGSTHFVDLGRTAPTDDTTEHERGLEVAIKQCHGFKARTSDGRWVYFVRSVAFTGTACAGMNPRHVTRALLSAGFLRSGTDGKNQVSRNFLGLGQMRAYHITADLAGPPETSATA